MPRANSDVLCGPLAWQRSATAAGVRLAARHLARAIETLTQQTRARHRHGRRAVALGEYRTNGKCLQPLMKHKPCHRIRCDIVVANEVESQLAALRLESERKDRATRSRQRLVREHRSRAECLALAAQGFDAHDKSTAANGLVSESCGLQTVLACVARIRRLRGKRASNDDRAAGVLRRAEPLVFRRRASWLASIRLSRGEI